MWFVFPRGVDKISVERQEFGVEGKDTEGKNCFRAPAHFAPKILAIPGFLAASTMAEGTIDDLSKDAQGQESAIAELSKIMNVRDEEVANLRADLISAEARYTALKTEFDLVKGLLENANGEIDDLKAELADGGRAASAAAPDGKGKAKAA